MTNGSADIKKEMLWTTLHHKFNNLDEMDQFSKNPNYHNSTNVKWDTWIALYVLKKLILSF